MLSAVSRLRVIRRNTYKRPVIQSFFATIRTTRAALDSSVFTLVDARIDPAEYRRQM